MTDVTLTADERKAIASLKRLERTWPKSLMLFTEGFYLHVVKLGPDGKRVMTKSNEFDQDYFVEQINISADGGQL